MSVASPHPLPTALQQQPSLAQLRNPSRSVPAQVAGLVFVATLAILPRIWNLGAPFETGDQAAIGHHLLYSFGLNWIVGHDYGPMLPLIQRISAELMCRLGIPIGEAAIRAPVVLLSLLIVPATFLLVRRLGQPRTEAWLCAVFAAFWPGLVCDAHCPWGYRTLWILTGVVALWATLAYIDSRRKVHLVIAAAGLWVHCLSCLYSYALPVTVAAAWWMAWRRGRDSSERQERVRVSHIAVGWVLPCCAALGVMVLAYLWTGHGQLAHLLLKQRHGSFGLPIHQVLELPAAWIRQLGTVFGAAAAMGMIASLSWFRRGGRCGLLALWAWVALLPIVLMTDWTTTGYHSLYLMMETGFTAGLLGVLWLAGVWRRYRRLQAGVAAVGALAALQFLLGNIDSVVPAAGLQALTGIEPCWGRVHADSGAKAAGEYVRRHVPEDATVLAVHDNLGMEVAVAQYYLGRYALADYDIPASAITPLVTGVLDRVDVIIVEPRHLGHLPQTDDFTCVAIFYRRNSAVRQILARPELQLPLVGEEVSQANRRYDEAYVATKLPMALPHPRDFTDNLEVYQQRVRGLKRAVRD